MSIPNNYANYTFREMVETFQATQGEAPLAALIANLGEARGATHIHDAAVVVAAEANPRIQELFSAIIGEKGTISAENLSETSQEAREKLAVVAERRENRLFFTQIMDSLPIDSQLVVISEVWDSPINSLLLIEYFKNKNLAELANEAKTAGAYDFLFFLSVGAKNQEAIMTLCEKQPHPHLLLYLDLLDPENAKKILKGDDLIQYENLVDRGVGSDWALDHAPYTLLRIDKDRKNQILDKKPSMEIAEAMKRAGDKENLTKYLTKHADFFGSLQPAFLHTRPGALSISLDAILLSNEPEKYLTVYILTDLPDEEIARIPPPVLAKAIANLFSTETKERLAPLLRHPLDWDTVLTIGLDWKKIPPDNRKLVQESALRIGNASLFARAANGVPCTNNLLAHPEMERFVTALYQLDPVNAFKMVNDAPTRSKFVSLLREEPPAISRELYELQVKFVESLGVDEKKIVLRRFPDFAFPNFTEKEKELALELLDGSEDAADDPNAHRVVNLETGVGAIFELLSTDHIAMIIDNIPAGYKVRANTTLRSLSTKATPAFLRSHPQVRTLFLLVFPLDTAAKVTIEDLEADEDDRTMFHAAKGDAKSQEQIANDVSFTPFIHNLVASWRENNEFAKAETFLKHRRRFDLLDMNNLNSPWNAYVTMWCVQNNRGSYMIGTPFINLYRKELLDFLKDKRLPEFLTNNYSTFRLYQNSFPHHVMQYVDPKKLGSDSYRIFYYMLVEGASPSILPETIDIMDMIETFGEDPSMLDLCIKHPEKWEEIFPKLGPLKKLFKKKLPISATLLLLGKLPPGQDVKLSMDTLRELATNPAHAPLLQSLFTHNPRIRSELIEQFPRQVSHSVNPGTLTDPKDRLNLLALVHSDTITPAEIIADAAAIENPLGTPLTLRDDTGTAIQITLDDLLTQLIARKQGANEETSIAFSMIVSALDQVPGVYFAALAKDPAGFARYKELGEYFPPASHQIVIPLLSQEDQTTLLQSQTSLSEIGKILGAMTPEQKEGHLATFKDQWESLIHFPRGVDRKKWAQAQFVRFVKGAGGNTALLKRFYDAIEEANRPVPAPVFAPDPNEAPDEFLCPITTDVMTDPVKLPSGKIVDRSSLIGITEDPFSRQPFKMADLIPQPELKARIGWWKFINTKDD